MSIIKVDRLSIGYEGIPVEKDISFKVEKGDYLCIVGENGSGKTTLMKTLLGLIPPLGGSIVFNAEDDPAEQTGKKTNKEEYSGLYKDPESDPSASDETHKTVWPEGTGTQMAGLAESTGTQMSGLAESTGIRMAGAVEKGGALSAGRDMAEKTSGGKLSGSVAGSRPETSKIRKPTKNGIGYLPQQTLVQRDFPASVREIVLSGCQGRSGLRPFYNREEKALAEMNMEKMGILQLKDRSYRELSGGQQQRVLLARALCATEKLLLLDEPVAGLDPKVTMEMYDLIRKLNDEGITIIMITHDIKVATMYASHILHLGARFFFGTTDEYLNSRSGKFFMLRQKGGVCL